MTGAEDFIMVNKQYLHNMVETLQLIEASHISHCVVNVCRSNVWTSINVFSMFNGNMTVLLSSLFYLILIDIHWPISMVMRENQGH